MLTNNGHSHLLEHATMTFFGHDFLRKVGMKHDFDIGSMTAFDMTIDMKDKNFYKNPLAVLAYIQEQDDEKHNECFHSTQILQAKYNGVNVNTITEQQKHLTIKQQGELQATLTKGTKLSSGKLGHYTHTKWI